MSQIDDIRAILFVKAKEFKTTDVDLLADINTEISLTIPLVSSSLGDSFNLGVALLTAHNMTLQSFANKGQSGSLKSEEIDDHKVTYSENKINGSSYNGSAYGLQYQQLLDLYKNNREFWGMLI